MRLGIQKGGQLTFFDEDTGVVKGEFAILEMQHTGASIGQFLRLAKAEHLSHHIQRGGAGFNRPYGVA